MFERITSADGDAILWTAAEILSWYKKPSFAEAHHAPDYIGNGSIRETALLLILLHKLGTK